MKSWIRRFGVVAVLGSLLCGVMVAGCGPEAEDDTAAVGTNNATTEPATDIE